MEVGTQIELDFRDSSEFSHICHLHLRHLRDLFEAIKGAQTLDHHTTAMLGSTVALVSTFMARPLEEITVDELANLGPAFQAHLKSRGYKRNSVRSYMNYRRILLREAEKFGWVRQPSPLPVEWESVLELMPKDRSYRTIAVFAASRGKKPLDLTDTDLEDWLQAAVSQGRSFRYARELKGYFHSHVLRLGLRGYFPKLSLHPTDCYGIPLRNLPEPLRTQVGDLLNWLMAPLSFGRGSNSQLRPISAKHLEYLICRIAGFVFNVRKEIASRLEDLVNQERFASYLEWCVNHRGVRTGSLATQCRALYAALRKFRPLRGMDFSWMRELIADLPRDSYRLTKERKDRKWVHWSELVQVPKKIRDEADKRYRANPRRYAIAVRDQLIMAWLLTLPWRQRNLRECKLLPYEQGGNLFKSEISPMATFAKPRWVRSILQSNPHEQFWQFYFTEGQTKTGREVHSLLPRRLVPRLEEYISKYRPLLVRGDDPGNLFLNSAGKPLTIQSVAYIVENVTVRFAGRRVTPHVFRDIVAVRRLECHPADFPSVARLLWHSSPNTLFKFYGRNYDESYGVQRMEEWLDEQAPEVVGALFGKDAT